ncbi:MAG TPA: DMT family transporter [Acidimicrobiales bacterium]
MSGKWTFAVALALGAALCYAGANVSQAISVRRQPHRDRIDLSLVVRMLRQPLWLAGLGASVVGFALEATALGLAPVVLVQPLVVAELLFALPLAALATGSRLGRRERIGALLVGLGLAAFALVVNPTNPKFTAGSGTWVVLLGVVAAAVGVMLLIAFRKRGIVRTSATAVAAAVVFGLLAVLTKTCARDFAAHGVAALATWQPWAVAGTGIIGETLAQNAFAAGPLAISLPLIDIGEPLVASIISIVVFGERISGLTQSSLAAILIAAAATTAGVIALDTSPLVQAAQRDFANNSTETSPITD